MIYGPSMWPFKLRWRNIIRRYILNKVEIISLRDHISKKYLNNLNLTHPFVYLTADSAFQNIINYNRNKIKAMMIDEKIIEPKDDNLNKKVLIGITPAGADWNYRGLPNPQKEQKKYNRIIAKAIDYLINKYNATIVFFPHLYGYSDDMPLINEIIRLVDKKGAVRVLSNKRDSEIQQGIISQMDLFIGNRYHSVIFALKQKIPAICLAYEHKSIGVMEAVKLNKFIINISNLTYENLVDKINQAWNQREKIRAELKSQIKIIRERSLMNSVLAMALIKCSMQGSTKKRELKIEIDKLIQEFHCGKLPISRKKVRQ